MEGRGLATIVTYGCFLMSPLELGREEGWMKKTFLLGNWMAYKCTTLGPHLLLTPNPFGVGTHHIAVWKIGFSFLSLYSTLLRDWFAVCPSNGVGGEEETRLRRSKSKTPRLLTFRLSKVKLSGEKKITKRRGTAKQDRKWTHSQMPKHPVPLALKTHFWIFHINFFQKTAVWWL